MTALEIGDFDRGYKAIDIGGKDSHMYSLLRTVMAVAAKENDIEPRKVSFKGAKQAVTAFAPKIEAARPANRGRLIDALLTTIAYQSVGDRPGRWEPRARKRRPEESQPAHATRALPSCRKTDQNSIW